MEVFRGQTEEKFLANMMLLSSGLFLIVSGYYFVTSKGMPAAATYKLMTGLMPFEAWGVLMIVAGVPLCAAVFQLGQVRNMSMLGGGILGAVIITLYAMASSQGAVTFLVPVRYAMMAGFNFLIAVLGGLQAWRTRKVTSRD